MHRRGDANVVAKLDLAARLARADYRRRLRRVVLDSNPKQRRRLLLARQALHGPDALRTEWAPTVEVEQW